MSPSLFRSWRKKDRPLTCPAQGSAPAVDVSHPSRSSNSSPVSDRMDARRRPSDTPSDNSARFLWRFNKASYAETDTSSIVSVDEAHQTEAVPTSPSPSFQHPPERAPPLSSLLSSPRSLDRPLPPLPPVRPPSSLPLLISTPFLPLPRLPRKQGSPGEHLSGGRRCPNFIQIPSHANCQSWTMCGRVLLGRSRVAQRISLISPSTVSPRTAHIPLNEELRPSWTLPGHPRRGELSTAPRLPGRRHISNLPTSCTQIPILRTRAKRMSGFLCLNSPLLPRCRGDARRRNHLSCCRRRA
ncbi:hypothetical protein B0H14DRAFT_602953 [Mycena olivaceomarginata]|nr:hypothetical protein B0H14DRAFT_602953 [Mycena olivaceomarginata]